MISSNDGTNPVESPMSDSSEEFRGLEGMPPPFHTSEENQTAFTDNIPQVCMEDSEMSTKIDYVADNTHVMNLDDLMHDRYREFNMALTDLSALVDMYAADKKTIKYIKDQYLQTYIKYFDVVKYIYGLDIADETVVPGTNPDRVVFKRDVVDPKRVKLADGRKLHIYQTKDGFLHFIDDVYTNGTGISLQDLAYWIENREKFADNYACVDNIPAQISIFGRTAFIPIKGLRIPRTGNIMADRFYAILGRLHKQIGDLLTEHKKLMVKRGHTNCSDDELEDDDN